MRRLTQSSEGKGVDIALSKARLDVERDGVDMRRLTALRSEILKLRRALSCALKKLRFDVEPESGCA